MFSYITYQPKTTVELGCYGPQAVTLTKKLKLEVYSGGYTILKSDWPYVRFG